MRFGRVFFLFPLIVLFLCASVSARPSSLFRLRSSADSAAVADSVSADTSVTYELLDIIGEELVGTRRNAGEKKMLGTFAVRISKIGKDTKPAPFVLRLTFENGGAFAMEKGRGNPRGPIRLRGLELRYRDRSEVAITKNFSRQASKSSGYVYEIEFLREDMDGLALSGMEFLPDYQQAQVKMELWSFVNEQEAKNAVGGLYRETINIEIEVKK